MRKDFAKKKREGRKEREERGWSFAHQSIKERGVGRGVDLAGDLGFSHRKKGARETERQRRSPPQKVNQWGGVDIGQDFNGGASRDWKRQYHAKRSKTTGSGGVSGEGRRKKSVTGKLIQGIGSRNKSGKEGVQSEKPRKSKEADREKKRRRSAPTNGRVEIWPGQRSLRGPCCEKN